MSGPAADVQRRSRSDHRPTAATDRSTGPIKLAEHDQRAASPQSHANVQGRGGKRDRSCAVEINYAAGGEKKNLATRVVIDGYGRPTGDRHSNIFDRNPAGR